MDLEKERARHDDLVQKAELITLTADEEKREVTKEEHRSFEDLMAQADQVQQRIDREQRIIEAKAKAERSHQPPTRPELGDKLPATYNQPVKFRSLGEFAQASVRASQPGGYVDPRLVELRAPSGMGEDLGSHGAFLVQTDFSQALLENIFASGTVANLCDRMSLSTNANSITLPAVDETSRADGSRGGGIAAAWTAEAGAKTPTQPHIRQIEIKLNKLTAAGYTTDELLADAPALGGFLTRQFTSEIRYRLDSAIIRGDGAGKPLGILASPALVSVTAEANQQAATIVPANLMKMYSRMIATSRTNAVWFINQDCEPQLMELGVAVGFGGSLVYMPPGGLSQAPYGTIFGRPVVPIEQCSTLGTVGDIIFADMGQYLLVDKAGIQSAMSIHVRFLNDETTFRFAYRVGGQPWWDSALTPATGSANTLSPFVALATRS